MTHTLITLARQYYQAFEHDKRTDGSQFWKRRDTCSEDHLQQLCFDAHADMLPDDYKYEFIIDALSILADTEADEAAERIEADCYTHDLTAWLHSRIGRVSYLTEVLESYEPKDGFQLLALAQYTERTEVFHSVLGSLHTILAATNEED